MGARNVLAPKTSFGPFSLDSAKGSLSRDGADLRLRPQAFDALKVLLENAGQFVSYEELIREAWSGNVVSRHTVATTIGAVRKALGEYGSWIGYRPKLGYRLQVPETEDLVRTGWHYLQRRTREGVDRALACFEQARRQNTSDPAPLDGVTTCYLLLATYGMRPPEEVYELFREAQAQAVALRGWTAKLRSERGRLLHALERRFTEAEAEFLEAQQERPTPVSVYINLAMLYASRWRLDEALDALGSAYELNPLQPTLPATEILVRFCRREFDIAVKCGKKGLDLHPYLHLGRAYYAQALEFCGRVEEALAQYRLASVIAPDMLWLRALEARCLANQGRSSEARVLLEQLSELRLSEYVDAYYMALLYEALGERDNAISELERIVEENSPTVYMMDVDPKMDSLRTDPRFPALRNILFHDALNEPGKFAAV
jgi:DNA-binding winged helix-turn-helix (wHTH) protein/Flp pilus assembly protein TadD